MYNKTKMRVLFLLVLVFVVGPIAAQDNRTFDFDYEYGDIRRLYVENKLDSAEYRLKHLEKMLLSSNSPFPAKEYSYTIYSLCDIYVRQNRFKECESIIDAAEDTLRLHGEQAYAHRKVLLIQKGQIRVMIENIEGAKKSFLEAKSIFEEEGDNSSIDYALCLSGLALTYQKTGDYCISNILNNVSVNIFKNVASTIGANLSMDSRYLTIWNNIALNYQYMGDFDKANEIQEEILKTGENGSGSYLVLVNEAYTEIQKGNYEKAIQLIDRANEGDYGYMYKDYAYQNLILSLYLSEDKHSINVLKHYIDYSKRNLSSVLLTYAEFERENYWSQRSLLLEMLTNAVSWKYQTPELLEESYNITLFTKSLLSRFSKILIDYAKNSSSNEIKEKYRLLLSLKKKIITKGISTDSVTAFQEKINTIERDLITSISNYRDIFDDSRITCDNVRKKLKNGEVAIEFVLFPEFHSGKEGTGYYGALIERSESEYPKFVKLCKFDSFDEAMDKGTLVENEFVDSLYSLHNEQLYHLIFQPLEKYLHDGETIYYSPVSGLHKVNVQAIPVNGQRLMDKYHLIEVSSTAQLLESNWLETQDQLSDAFLIGGVDYSENIEDMALEALNYVRSGLKTYVTTRSANRGSWDPISGTLIEAQQIDSILCSKKVKTVFLSGGKASEEAFKNLDGNSPAIIHFATHGFFYEEKGDATTQYFDNTNSYANKRLPMQFSGLLLAGANNAWKGNLPPMNIEDGILTAEEISQMDLSRTKIAMLSACDTGLGKIDDIDGVYGLQRGFKMAGVETIVMSLWKVPDDATQILMVEFYKNLMSGKSKLQSLKDAQKYLRQVDNGKFDKPEYWASFIMLDGLN